MCHDGVKGCRLGCQGDGARRWAGPRLCRERDRACAPARPVEGSPTPLAPCGGQYVGRALRGTLVGVVQPAEDRCGVPRGRPNDRLTLCAPFGTVRSRRCPMEHAGADDEREALARSRQTVAEQSAEIERLRRELADQRLAEELRDAFKLTATAGLIAAPSDLARLLDLVVRTAAQAIKAQAGALFLVDRATEELAFEVAIGPKAAEVRKLRVPLGHGIAGLVAVTGQPMAISDAQHDPRHASDIARSVGYWPQSIVCSPLFFGDEVIGVLELLDKEGAPSFSAVDVEQLGLFASLAGVAIEQSRAQRSLAALLREALEPLGGTSAERKRELEQRAGAAVDHLEEDPAYRRALALARLVREIAGRGERELEACQAILEGFAGYLRSRPQSIGELGEAG